MNNKRTTDEQQMNTNNNDNNVKNDKNEINNINIYNNILKEKINKKESEVEIVEKWQMQFKDFYNRYPKKIKKKDVEKWFSKNKPSDELFDLIITSLDKFKNSQEWKKENGQYIPHPTTWLNQKRWEDENINQNNTLSALQRAWERSE